MKDRYLVEAVYFLFIVFFSALIFYGFYTGQYLLAVVAAGIVIFIAKDFSRETQILGTQEKILDDIIEDIKIIEKNSNDIEKDAYPHVPFINVHRIDYNFYHEKIKHRINNKSTRALLSKLRHLSRHIESMNDTIVYLRERVNDQYLVNFDMTEGDLYYEITRLEGVAKTIRYDEKAHVELTKLLIRLHKCYILKHRHAELLKKNEGLVVMLNGLKQEMSRFLPAKEMEGM